VHIYRREHITMYMKWALINSLGFVPCSMIISREHSYNGANACSLARLPIKAQLKVMHSRHKLRNIEGAFHNWHLQLSTCAADYGKHTHSVLYCIFRSFLLAALPSTIDFSPSVCAHKNILPSPYTKHIMQAFKAKDERNNWTELDYIPSILRFFLL
jgi:hypothetical protein